MQFAVDNSTADSGGEHSRAGHADLSTTQRYMHSVQQQRKTRSGCWTGDTQASWLERTLETFWTRDRRAEVVEVHLRR